MASSAPNKSFIGRAAAILVDGSEVAGAAFDLNRAWGSQVTVDLSFTKGSLTNMIARFYVSMDGVTYDPLYDAAGAIEFVETLTANGERAYVLPNLSGWKFFRVSAEGTGTATGSSCEFVYRYLKRGSQ